MEIEIKATIADMEKTEEKLKHVGAKLEKEEQQTDVYYNSPVKNIKGIKEYIRLRVKDKKAIFAYHLNKDDGTEEKEVEISDADKFKEILNLTGFRELGTIEKTRKKFSYNGFAICLDAVKDIGLFIEVEAQGKEAEIAEKREQCLKVLDVLGISRANLSNLWLCDIATGVTKLKSKISRRKK